MSIIKLLDKDTIDKIAAGEVVDRPSSIVKELTENAIDAGSTSISIEIKDGGISLIRITDNGCGIAKNQISTAFLRHSTSKINNANDLSFIHTLGFRGEALSSIAAVSKMELCTKTKDELTGIIYKIEGGVEQSCADAGLPNGTTVIVKDIFFNTPARLKFLRSAQTEAGYITDIVQRIAISHPEISFKYVVNGANKLVTSGNKSCKDAIYGVFGRDITANLLDIDFSNDFLTIDGFIGKPELSRGNRNFEFFFINGRYVKDKIISRAVEDAYAGYMMKNMFPFAVLNIKLEPELVDVNVHPSKMEVRFYNQEGVYDSILNCIRDRITKRENIPVFTIDRKKEQTETVLNNNQIFDDHSPKALTIFDLAENDQNGKNVSNTKSDLSTNSDANREKLSFDYTDKINLNDSSFRYSIPEPFQVKESMAFHENLSNQAHKENAFSYEQTDLFTEKFISREAKAKHRIIGEVFDTYWLVEFNDNLYIIDQHAAHEKVLYEQFVNDINNKKHYSQKIIPSAIVTLSSSEEISFRKYRQAFFDMGFEIEEFGGNEYAISAIPADFTCDDYRTFFIDILDELYDNASFISSQLINDRIATAACKAAVKGGNRLSFAEADALIEKLLELDNPYNCPHGRPTIITMSRTEMEKKFKRII